MMRFLQTPDEFAVAAVLIFVGILMVIVLCLAHVNGGDGDD